ncbi:MAG: hypothetical protein R2991_13905 [Thermoanaerobaculia bacterium]
MTEAKRESVARLKTAWEQLPPAEIERLRPQIEAAHRFVLDVRDGRTLDAGAAPPRELFMVKSILEDDPDGLIAASLAPEGEETRVLSDGAVLFGGVYYDATDVDWAYTEVAWHVTGPTPPFPGNPVSLRIPDHCAFAILGDWGGNNTPAQQVGALSKSMGDHFVHLGDVYYAGTAQSGVFERDYQRSNFLDVWPGPFDTSFNLNSNHDMYAHAQGYYGLALTPQYFAAQKGCGYFALYNASFRLVGLDTAYYDPDPGGMGFMTGSLGPDGPNTQVAFLRQQAVLAAQQKQTLVLMSHHNGLDIGGNTPEPLWNEVAACLTPLAGRDVFWYWGHVHVGAVYKPRTAGGATVHGRCCGHGCIPWGVASDLVSPGVAWAETQVVGPGPNYFVTNGFASLHLDGAKLAEAFYGQSGIRPHWTNVSG